MEKVQTGLVIDFYSNSCLVRTKDADISCIAIKDVVVGDIVKIEIIKDSKKIKGLILSREPRFSILEKKEVLKSKVVAANVTHVGILVTPEPKTSTDFIDKCSIFFADVLFLSLINHHEVIACTLIFEEGDHAFFYKIKGFEPIELILKEEF